MPTTKITVKSRKLNGQEKRQIKESVKDNAFKQLEKQAKTLFSRVNKRIRTLERASNRGDIVSPALNSLRKKRGQAPRFGTKGSYSDLETLKKEMAQAQAFDNMETSTLSGARAYTENLKQQIPNINELDDSAINLIFDALHGLHERMPTLLYSGLLQYSEYLDTVIEQAENTDLSMIDNYELRLNTLIDKAIEELSNKVADTVNDGIGILSRGMTRLF